MKQDEGTLRWQQISQRNVQRARRRAACKVQLEDSLSMPVAHLKCMQASHERPAFRTVSHDNCHKDTCKLCGAASAEVQQDSQHCTLALLLEARSLGLPLRLTGKTLACL